MARKTKEWIVLSVAVAAFAQPVSARADTGDVLSEQKLSREAGSFDGDVRAGDGFGSGVEALGDLDGDGTADVAVGAPGEEGGSVGSFYIVFLQPDGTARATEKYLSGASPVAVPDSEFGIDLANFGWSARLAGSGATNSSASSTSSKSKLIAGGCVDWFFGEREDESCRSSGDLLGFGHSSETPSS